MFAFLGRFRGPIMVAFIVAGVALIALQLADGDVEGALWAALRLLGRLA